MATLTLTQLLNQHALNAGAPCSLEITVTATWVSKYRRKESWIEECMFTAANSFAATLCSSNSEIVAVTAGDAQRVSHTRQSCTMRCDVKCTVVQCRMAKGWRQLIPTECLL